MKSDLIRIKKYKILKSKNNLAFASKDYNNRFKINITKSVDKLNKQKNKTVEKNEEIEKLIKIKEIEKELKLINLDTTLDNNKIIIKSLNFIKEFTKKSSVYNKIMNKIILILEKNLYYDPFENSFKNKKINSLLKIKEKLSYYQLFLKCKTYIINLNKKLEDLNLKNNKSITDFEKLSCINQNKIDNLNEKLIKYKEKYKKSIDNMNLILKENKELKEKLGIDFNSFNFNNLESSKIIIENAELFKKLNQLKIINNNFNEFTNSIKKFYYKFNNTNEYMVEKFNLIENNILNLKSFMINLIQNLKENSNRLIPTNGFNLEENILNIDDKYIEDANKSFKEIEFLGNNFKDLRIKSKEIKIYFKNLIQDNKFLIYNT